MSGGGTVRSLFSVNDSNRWKIRKISEQYVASVQTLLTYKNNLSNKLRNSGKMSGGWNSTISLFSVNDSNK